MLRALAVALALLPATLFAQVGVTTDIITGRVTSPDGQPMPGVSVRVVSAETQIGRNAVTNSDGRYTIVFPDGGGQYRVEARFVGYQPTRLVIGRQADEDRLVADIKMGTAIPVLSTVTTTARRNQPRGDAGGTGRFLSPQQIEKLPIDGTDPNALAALAPGVVALSASDTTSSSFSVAGQRPTLNSVTLDGTTFAGSSIPQEAVRNTRVITNTYDVSRGQFTGGQVASTTRGGTNVPAGSFSYYFRNPALAYGEQGPSGFSQMRNQNQLSGGIGGPIIPDHVFTFSAVNLSRRSNDLIDLANEDPAQLAQIGVPAAAVRSALLQQGVPFTSPLVPDDRDADNLTAFERLDFLIGDDNSIVLRGDFRGRLQDGTRVSPYSLPTAGGHVGGAGGGVFLSWTTHLPGNFINELRTYGQRDYQSADPYLSGVAGRISLEPAAASATTGITTVGFGGNPGLPQSGYNDLWESTDEVSWLSPRGGHRVRLGLLVDLGRSSQLFNQGVNGIYTYNSLTAFAQDSASTFTRTFNANAYHASSVSGAAYLGDTWVPWSPLQLTYGVRVEGTDYSGAPADNVEVANLFGQRTDIWPTEIHVSPRVGFTYQIRSGAGGPPSAVIRGGYGEFRANAPLSLFSSAQSENGAANGETQLICIGPDVPFNRTTGWAGYLDGTTPIPTTCASGAGSTPGSVPLRQVAVFDRDFESPRAWRGSLGIQKRLLDRLNGSLDLSYARGVDLFGVTDANLNTSNPAFALPYEGGRPVYSNLIDPTTGAVSFAGSRRFGQYGQVYDINSRLQSDTRQMTVSINGFTLRGIAYQFAYTYQQVRDQSSFSGGSALVGFGNPTTAGNPNAVGWGPSDLGRTHQFLTTVTWPIVPALELTTIARLTSGTPFTPAVSQDINGNGARNDRAFVFNPAAVAGTPDSALAGPMRQLLATTSGRVRDCLESQIGQVAGRNSCLGPWTPSFDVQLNYRPASFGLQRRLTLSLLAVNTLTGVDELVHGPNHLAGWGQPFPPDNILLYVRGFSTTPQPHFIYTVNQHFGQPYSAFGAYSAPFQLVFEARYSFGDVSPDQLRGLLGGGGGNRRDPGAGGAGAGGANGGAMSLADQVAGRFAERFPNTFDQILALKDTLALTPDQVGKLTTASDSLKEAIGAMRGKVSTALAKLGNNPDPGTLMSLMRPELLEARTMRRAAVAAAQAILTPDQWKKVPDAIRTTTARQ